MEAICFLHFNAFSGRFMLKSGYSIGEKSPVCISSGKLQRFLISLPRKHDVKYKPQRMETSTIVVSGAKFQYVNILYTCSMYSETFRALYVYALMIITQPQWDILILGHELHWRYFFS